MAPSSKTGEIAGMTYEATMRHPWVFPTHKKEGMPFHRHTDVINGLQPNATINDPEDYVHAARRILQRQRVSAKMLPRFSCRAKSANYAAILSAALQNAKQDQLDVEHISCMLQSQQAHQVPVFPGRRNATEDVGRITARLSTYDPEKIPESRGYPIKLDLPVVYRTKEYSEEQVTDIVSRLSTYNPEKCPPESRPPGSAPHMITAPSRQTLGSAHVKKCSAEQVQEIVNRLSRYDPWKWPPGSRNPRGLQSRA